VRGRRGALDHLAGALADATEMEERAGSGPPLSVALIGDTNHYHSELNGILDNAIARREVLHDRAGEPVFPAESPEDVERVVEVARIRNGRSVFSGHDGRGTSQTRDLNAARIEITRNVTFRETQLDG